MPVKKNCSRLLKYFHDDYIVNRRSLEDEYDIIDKCIDANLPFPVNEEDNMRFLQFNNVTSKKTKDSPDGMYKQIAITEEEKEELAEAEKRI